MTQPLSTAQYTDDPHQPPMESVEDYAIYALDARGHLRSWNAGAERIEGYSADEILGRHFSIFYPEEDIRSGKPARELEGAARAGRFENEGWRLRKDGTRFWANVVITASREEEGKLVGFAKITRDLTARRATEEQARELAVESAARAAAEQRREEVERLNEELQQRAVELETQTEEAQALTEELEAANLELAEAVREAESAREVARRSEERYRLLFDATPMPVWVYDRETLRFLAVNAAAVKQYGYTHDEFLVMTLADIHPAEDAARLRRAVADAPHELRQLTGWRHRRSDGSLMDVELVGHPIEFDGRHAELILVQDVTQRRGLEAQLRQAQKMEAVGQLAGGVAHDFNNLLTVITSYSGLLLAELPEDSPVRADVEQISGAASRAAGLTRQLLAFSRKQMLRPQVLVLNNIVSGLEEMLRRLLPENIEIVTSLDPGLGVVEADPGQVEQVIVNLVVNAGDAMPGGGTLTIQTANTVFDEASLLRHGEIAMAPGRYAMLTVSDTGSGMTPDVQAHAFEPFYTTKPPGQGTGLGLSTVYGIVKQSGGYIWVYSEPGEGTAFNVYLPRVDADPDSGGPG